MQYHETTQKNFKRRLTTMYINSPAENVYIVSSRVRTILRKMGSCTEYARHNAPSSFGPEGCRMHYSGGHGLRTGVCQKKITSKIIIVFNRNGYSIMCQAILTYLESGVPSNCYSLKSYFSETGMGTVLCAKLF